MYYLIRNAGTVCRYLKNRKHLRDIKQKHEKNLKFINKRNEIFAEGLYDATYWQVPIMCVYVCMYVYVLVCICV